MAQGRSTKIISMIKWIRTSRLSIQNSLSLESGRSRAELASGTGETSRSAFPRSAWKALPRAMVETVHMNGLKTGYPCQQSVWREEKAVQAWLLPSNLSSGRRVGAHPCTCSSTPMYLLARLPRQWSRQWSRGWSIRVSLPRRGAVFGLNRSQGGIAPQRPGLKAVRGLCNIGAATSGQHERRGCVPADPALLSDPHNRHPRVYPDRHLPHTARAGRGEKAGQNTPTRYAAHTTGRHIGKLCPLR